MRVNLPGLLVNGAEVTELGIAHLVVGHSIGLAVGIAVGDVLGDAFDVACAQIRGGGFLPGVGIDVGGAHGVLVPVAANLHGEGFVIVERGAHFGALHAAVDAAGGEWRVGIVGEGIESSLRIHLVAVCPCVGVGHEAHEVDAVRCSGVLCCHSGRRHGQSDCQSAERCKSVHKRRCDI